MWKVFLILALYASYRLWQHDHSLVAGVALFSGIMIFWSAGVIDNYARASGNYNNVNSMAEMVAVAANFLFTIVSIGLLIYSFF